MNQSSDDHLFAPTGLEALQMCDDGHTFLSRLWREIWNSAKPSFERDSSAISSDDLKDHVLAVSDQLEDSHPDSTILLPLLQTLQSSGAIKTDPAVIYIIRLARIVLYATSGRGDRRAPSNLLRAIVHLNTMLDIHLQFDLTQLNKVTLSNSEVCRAYLRLIVTATLNDSQWKADLKASHYESVKVVNTVVRHWPGTLSEESLSKVACFCSKMAITGDRDYRRRYTGTRNESLLDQDVEKGEEGVGFVAESRPGWTYRTRRTCLRCLRTCGRVFLFLILFVVFAILSLLLIYSVGS